MRSSKDLLVYFAIPVALGAWFLLYRTSWGLRMRLSEKIKLWHLLRTEAATVAVQALFVAAVRRIAEGTSRLLHENMQEGMTPVPGSSPSVSSSLRRGRRFAPFWSGALRGRSPCNCNCKRVERTSPRSCSTYPYLLVLVVLMLFGRVRGRVVPWS